MTAPRLRLLLVGAAAVAFLVWIGWLGYLAATASRPVVVSRPQLLASNLDVVARVDALDKPVQVKEVLWSEAPDAKPLEGQTIPVGNLAKCKDDWKGPGDYLLPLVREAKAGEETYQVARPPAHSPGIDPARPPHVYPATPETRAQQRLIRSP